MWYTDIRICILCCISGFIFLDFWKILFMRSLNFVENDCLWLVWCVVTKRRGRRCVRSWCLRVTRLFPLIRIWSMPCGKTDLQDLWTQSLFNRFNGQVLRLIFTTAEKINLVSVSLMALALSAKVFGVSARSVWNSLSCDCRSADLLRTLAHSFKEPTVQLWCHFVNIVVNIVVTEQHLSNTSSFCLWSGNWNADS